MKPKLYDLIINTNLNFYTYYTLIRVLFTSSVTPIVYNKNIHNRVLLLYETLINVDMVY